MPALPTSLRPLLSCAIGAASMAIIGCSASSGGDGGSGGAGVGGAGPGPTTTSSITVGVGGSTTTPDAEVFAHSDTLLFRLDPITKEVSNVGIFNGDCQNDPIIDIAIDEAGQMFAASFSALYRVDSTNAQCTFLATGSYPNSMSFVPKGTVDPNEEVLVGYVGGNYVRIDKATGMQTTLGILIDGSLPMGGNYVSSGDVVSVINGGTYLTITGADCNDCIAQVDPVDGALLTVIGPLDRQDVYGLAFWGGAAYGFTAIGELVEINLTDASTIPIPIPAAPPSLEFWGAGSTTAAPLTPIE